MAASCASEPRCRLAAPSWMTAVYRLCISWSAVRPSAPSEAASDAPNSAPISARSFSKAPSRGDGVTVGGNMLVARA